MLSRRRFLAASLAAPLIQSFDSAGALGADAAIPMIDAHVHVWKTDPAFPFSPGARPPIADASAEKLLGLMKANGVVRTVIVQVIYYHWDNRYAAYVLKKYPQYFHGVCRVNPQDPAAPDQLSQLTEEQGFRGVRISPSARADGDWIRGPLMPPLWKRCAQLKVPMVVLAPVTRMPDLMPLIEQNPDLNVVIDHMADSPANHPEELDLLLALARYPKVYVKISHMWSVSQDPYPYPDAAAQVKRLYDKFGAKRLMWATDWPISLRWLPYSQAVALYRDHLNFIQGEDRRQILYKTVQSLWPFGIQ